MTHPIEQALAAAGKVRRLIIPMHLDGWRCSRCGSEWSYYFHECPDCDATTEGEGT